jgi:hypothetical protein
MQRAIEPDMNAVALTDELNQLIAEVARLERRIAEGEGGITDHILLQATLRTQARARNALARNGVGWVISVRPSAGITTHSDARPRNTAQLFASSTHRVVGLFGS